MSTAQLIRRSAAAAAVAAGAAVASNQQQTVQCQASTAHVPSQPFTHTQQIQTVAKQIFGPTVPVNTTEPSETALTQQGIVVHPDPFINSVIVQTGINFANDAEIIAAVKNKVQREFGSWLRIGSEGEVDDAKSNSSGSSNSGSSSRDNTPSTLRSLSGSVSLADIATELEQESFSYWDESSGVLLSAEQLRSQMFTGEQTVSEYDRVLAQQRSPSASLSPLSTSLSPSLIFSHASPSTSLRTPPIHISPSVLTESSFPTSHSAVSNVPPATPTAPVAPGQDNAAATDSTVPPTLMERMYSALLQPLVSWLRARLAVPTTSSSSAPAVSVPAEGIPHAVPVQQPQSLATGAQETETAAEPGAQLNAEQPIDRKQRIVQIVQDHMVVIIGVAGVLIVLAATRRFSPALFHKIVAALMRK